MLTDFKLSKAVLVFYNICAFIYLKIFIEHLLMQVAVLGTSNATMNKTKAFNFVELAFYWRSRQ